MVSDQHLIICIEREAIITNYLDLIFSSTDMQLGAKTASFWTIISYNFVSQKGICYIRVFLCPFSFVSNQHPEQQKKNFSKNNKTEYPDEDALQKTDRKRTKVAL